MEKPRLEKSVSFAEAHIVPGKYRNLKNIPHWHREHELVFVQSGGTSVMVNGALYTLRAGESAFLHSEDVHSICAEPGALLYVAKLDAHYLHPIIGAKRLRTPVLTGDYAVGDIFAALFDERRTADAYSSVIADSLMTRLTAMIFRHEPPAPAAHAPSAADEAYRSLLERIVEHYADITFDDAAEAMHFSKPYFSKFFYHRAGMTFTHYLNMVKISHAVELVRKGELTMTEISRRCGFNTIRNFNRVFKAMTGCAPHSLPADYQFVYQLKDYVDCGFDPTLSCTEIIDA